MATAKSIAATLAFLAAARPAAALSPDAEALIAQAFSGLDGREIVDYHVHALGLGDSGSGIEVDPRLRSWTSPVVRLKGLVFMRSAGITDEGQADAQYQERLLSLARGFPRPIRLALLAFDRAYRPDGTVDAERSEFHIPNAFVMDLANRHPEEIVPVVSVHPYAPDAVPRLEALARQGARMVKWLPNAQGMDPSDPALDPFYEVMARHGMILLCHTGHESSVHSPDGQRLGNPLLLRRALDRGVTVIMAHAGNRGSSADLDHPGRQARNFELVLRLMDEPRYRGRLFADLSAVTQTLRNRDDLKVLLERSDLHPRLVNGSDYPLPAISVFIQPWLLQMAGFITGPEREALMEIRRENPLLFDFVLKRSLRHPETGARFPAEIFGAHPALCLSPSKGVESAAMNGGENP